MTSSPASKSKTSTATRRADVTLAEAKPQLTQFLQQQKKQEEMGKVLRTVREGAEVQVNLPEAQK